MTKKDEASPRQRQIMEERWEKARADCAYERCDPAYRFHAAGCPRRAQKVKVTNLNTGVISEATIVHSDVRAVKDVLADHDKQAVRLEPEENWSGWEKGLFEDRIEETHQPYKFPLVTPSEAAPARPWWKFWGRRG